MKKLTTNEIVALVAAAVLVIAPFLAGVVLSSSLPFVGTITAKVSVFGTSAFAGILSLIAAAVLAAGVFVKPEVYAGVKVAGKPVEKYMINCAAAVIALLAFILVLTAGSVEATFTIAGETVTQVVEKASAGSDDVWSSGLGCWFEFIGAAVAACAAYLEFKKK